MNTRATVATLAIGIALGLVIPLTVAACYPDPTDTPAPAPAVSEAPALPTLTLPPCETEDSQDCYWDAARMGNGQGASFVNIAGTYYYPGN